MPRDFYDVLGLKRGASPDDIKKAYRGLSKELHPDKHKGDKAAETKFKEVNEAYETLSDPKKKQMYDQFGSAGPGMGGSAGAGGFGGFDFSSFTGGDAGGFADLFEGFFGGGRGQQRAEERGSDREVDITITLQEVFAGVQRMMVLRKLTSCSHCGGSGAEKGSSVITCATCGGTGQVTRTAQSFFGTVQQRSVCPHCRGSGKVPEKACKKCDGEGRVQESVEVAVNVPAGIENGQTLRIRGEGDAGRRGSPSGDLYVNVRVQEDKNLRREGEDIHARQEISVVDALLGTELTTETLHGPVTLKIPEGTQPEQVFRLKGKGLPRLSTKHYGDHYVTVAVKIPAKLSRQERKLLEEWKEIR